MPQRLRSYEDPGYPPATLPAPGPGRTAPIARAALTARPLDAPARERMYREFVEEWRRSGLVDNPTRGKGGVPTPRPHAPCAMPRAHAEPVEGGSRRDRQRVARRMRASGLAGASRCRGTRTRRRERCHGAAVDRVVRQTRADAPERIRATDIERHAALLNLVVAKAHCHRPVAARRLKRGGRRTWATPARAKATPTTTRDGYARRLMNHATAAAASALTSTRHCRHRRKRTVASGRLAPLPAGSFLASCCPFRVGGGMGRMIWTCGTDQNPVK